MKNRMGKKLSIKEVWQKGINRIATVFLDFELMLLRWVGHIPSHTIRLFCYKLADIKIGSGSALHMWANFFNPANISIGEDTIIGDHAFLDGRAELAIGSHVAVASQVLMYNAEHDIHRTDFACHTGKVVIEDYVFIGPRAIILPGVTIGKGAVIAAGAVGTTTVRAQTIAGGVPAREIGKRTVTDLHYRLGRARLFQ